MRVHSALSLLTVAVWSLLSVGCGGSTHEALAQESVGVFEELNTELEGVKDAASAKAAATKIEAIVTRMNAVKAKMEALGKPSADMADKMDKTIAARMAKAMENMTKHMMRIGADPKMSEPLQSAMEKMKN